jgi:hypothetical protein
MQSGVVGLPRAREGPGGRMLLPGVFQDWVNGKEGEEGVEIRNSLQRDER